MSRNIRLLAVDLDGTLLSSERKPVEISVEALRRARDAGIMVVLASGRVAPSVRYFAKLVGLDAPIVCANGSHVLDANDSDIYHLGLAPEVLTTLTEYADETSTHLNIYARERLMFHRDSGWVDMYRKRVGMMEPTLASSEELIGLEATKLMLVDTPENIPGHIAQTKVLLHGLKVRLVQSEPEYLEFLHPDADKGSGLQAICDRYGIPQCETAAIGDYWNDLEMIRWVGFSAAIGNATPDVVSAAHVKVRTNEDAGVAEFVDLIFAQR